MFTSDEHSGTLVTGLVTMTGHTMAIHVDEPRGPVPKVREVHGLDVQPQVYDKLELDEDWVFRGGVLYVGDAVEEVEAWQ